MSYHHLGAEADAPPYPAAQGATGFTSRHSVEDAFEAPKSAGWSKCTSCGERYPSAPPGTVHKCGKCSGGICRREDAFALPAKPSTVHPSHDVREEGLYISDPVCQNCRVGVQSLLIFEPCVSVHAAAPVVPQQELAPTDRWWAQRWIDKATPGELAAMRELLG